MNCMPEYFAQNNYRYSENGKLPWHMAAGTDLDFFPWLQSHPTELEQFQASMSLPLPSDWLSVVPLKEISGISLEADPERTIFVDVGGNAGHECVKVTSFFPELRGHVVLQDLEQTIQHAKPIEGVTAMAHNFFTPQVIKGTYLPTVLYLLGSDVEQSDTMLGARFYYLGRVLHDWSDEKALDILANLKSALAPDSEILIDEIVLPNVDAPPFATALDFAVFVLAGSRERTLDEWQSLLEKAGLTISEVKTYNASQANSVIVARQK
jgi:demethylsterigmatocystin 6-O-methyltransferase